MTTAFPLTEPAVRSPLVARISAVAAARPGAPAITGAQGSLHYGELDELRTAWWRDLTDRAIPPGSVIALVVADPLFLGPAFLAARSAGLVPLLVDPHMPPARRAAVFAAARPALTMRVAGTPEYEPGAATPRVLDPAAGYLGFTSGTQGPPKGIVANENGAFHFVEWEIGALGLRPGTRVAQLSPPTFEVIIRELFVTLCGGGELLAAPSRVRANAAAVVPWLADQEAELVHVVPGLSTRWTEAAPGHRLPRLRWTVFAGEPLHAGHVHGWWRSAPHSEIINVYGPSETTLAKFWYRVPDNPLPGVQPVGRPLPGTRLLTSAAPGTPFPVTIETPHGSLGYLPGTASAADHAALVRRDGVTTFASKDLGMVTDDGSLVITGRSDSRVKRLGVFVDLTVIEETAAGQPDVRLACCLQTGPEKGGALVLFVEPASDLAAAGLLRRLRRELGPGAPDDVVALPRMPLSPNGKVDRRALAEQLAGKQIGAAA
ncbi:AMP-binding protein [Amycolatopsis sp. GM8]|uniref:AMP-binding protein n=1 Tax=Amycolatopsis sp. GM8 TaxID=2896530 RepID=UPI001F1AAC7B|nr:AMP-binding protein [Amycolatopsis sp. GM8]